MSTYKQMDEIVDDEGELNYQIQDLKNVLTKQPENRSKEDLNMLLPFIQDIEFFKEQVENQDQELLAKTHLYICQNMRYKMHKQGETVFKHGNRGNLFYIILKGKVSVNVPLSKAQPKMIVTD